MVTQNTTTAGAASAARHIQLTQPQANQQVVIDNIAGAALDMSFPSEAAQLEQSGQDLVFLFENGGRIVLSNFFGLFDSHQLPAFNLEDGQSLPGDAFLAALREDLLPAAGPGAGAAAGSGGVGDYADDAGNLIGGVDRLDPLGTGTFGTAALPGIEDAGPLDLATGTLLVSLTTGITTTIGENGGYPEHPDAVPPGTYVGVFEDWEPNQHLGSHLVFQAAFGFTFTPDDNEVLNTITFTGPIEGTLLVNGVEVLPDGAGNYVIAAADIGNVTLQPLADSGVDIPLSGFATITDPDSGLSGTVPFAFTAVVDAVADQPIGLHETVTYGPFYCDHGNGDYGNGEVIAARAMDSDGGDERSFWHHNPHDAPDGPWWKHTAADPTNGDASDHTQSAVHITLSATFGDYQDGSEQHYLIIEAKDGWTYATVNIDGVEFDLADFLRSAADVPVTGAQADGLTAEAYYVIPVGEESIVYETTVGGREVATKAVTLTLYPPDEHFEPGGNGGYEGNGEYEGPVIAMTEQGGEGQHCGPSGNDYKETFVTGALAVDNDADGSLTTVNDTSLALGSADVWVAAAEGHIYVTGQQIGYEDPQAYVNEPWYDPFSTKDIDLDFHFKGADDEQLDYLRIAVDPETPAKVLVFGHEALLMHDDDGDYYVVPAHLMDHVTLMPAKDSDVDVKLTVTAVFHDPDSGDVGTDTTQHTVFVDAVADKPIAHDADVDYTPGPTAGDPGGTLTVTLNATFGDYQDGSERQYVGIEVKHGWSYPDNEGYKWVEGRLYAIYDVTDAVDAGHGSVSLPVTLGVVNTDDRFYTEFKTIAIAKETNFSGVEWNGSNNEAYDTDSVRVLVDGANGCLQVSGQGYEDRMPNAHDGNPYNDAPQPIKLGIDLHAADDEVIDSVNIKALGQSFTIVVDGVPTHLSTGQSINIDGSKANNVYIIPEEHNGKDISIKATAIIHDPDSGDFAIRDDTATIVIDAVADKPVNLFETVNYGGGHDAIDPPDGATVNVTATFADVHDGSEKHFIGIEYKSGWNYPSGGQDQWINGVKYKVYDVTSMDNAGTVTKSLHLDLVDNTDNRFTTNFKTVAIAVDSEPGDSDSNGLTTGNNTAYTFGDVNVIVDGANGCLQVSGGGYEDWMPDAHEGNMAMVKTALNINFTPADIPAHGPEVLDNVVVKFAGKAFTLVVGDGPGAHEYTLDSTHTQVTVTAANAAHLYIKTAADSDTDIPLKVTANFHDPNSDDLGSLTVDHTVVIDAVADKPVVSITHIETDTNPNDLEPSYQFGETGKVHVHATFGDYSDGSETHTVTVVIPNGFEVVDNHGGTVSGSTITWTVSGGSFDKDISFTYKGEANDGTATFTATATADETNFSGSGLDLTNNHAETSATASVVIADHAPSAHNAAAEVSEDELDVANPLFDGTHVADVSSTTVHSGTLAYDFGNGGKGGFSWTLPGAQGTETDADDPATPNVLHNLTSGGETLAWELSTDGHTLIGKADGAEVIRVELTNIDTGAYKVTLSGPIDHPDNASRFPADGYDRGTDDMLEISVPYTITDGFGVPASGTVFVTVLDDAPTAGDVLGTATANGSIPHFMPDGYELNMVGSEHDPSNLITITATAPDGHGNPNPVFTADGGGVSSDGDRLDEIDFFRGSGSEALVIDLGGKLALGATVNLGKFYSEEPTEKGVVEFYRDGELVATRTFSAVSGSGDADVSFSISEGPFDKMVFKALDNGVTGLGDNSDYYVESITFQSAPAVPVGYANGVVPHIFGADGPGKVWLSGMDETDSSVKTMAGEAVRLVMSADGTVVHGYVGTGTEQAFELRMTPTTGEWDFIQYKQLNIADHQLDFRYSVVDGDGDVITQQLDVKVLDFSPPHAGDPLSIGLDDAGAAGGAVDSHTAHLTFTAGSDGLTAGDYSFADPAAHAPTVSGLTGTIVWSVDGSGHLIGSIGGHPTIELSLSGGGNTGVDVTAKLIDPLHHTDGSTDVTVTGIHVVANDGVTAPATGTVNINIADDHPIAHDDAATYNPATTNVVIVLDVSASMGPNASYGGGDPDGPGGFATKFDLAKAAITDLLSAYHDLGSVNVKIVWFGDTAETHTGWLSGSNVLSDAQGVLNGVTLQTYTHYDDAITLVKGQLATMPTADRSVMYFLSDGEPNPSGEALNSTETAQWETALQGSHMDIVYAIGIGNGVTDTTNLATVGWERGVTGDANTVEIITTPSDLSGHLLATLPTHGNLINNDTAGADGDKHLYSVTLGADTYHVGDADATTHVLKLTLADGKGILTIDFDDGSFQYFPGHYPVGTAAIQYTIADGDGSHSNTATLNLTLNGAYVDAHDNYANAPLPGRGPITETFDNDSHGWSTDPQPGGDPDGYVTRTGGELKIALTANSDSIATSKSFTVANGETVSFDWRTVVTGTGSHDNDKLQVEISGIPGATTLYTVGNGDPTSGTFSKYFATGGTYTITVRAVDGTSGGSTSNQNSKGLEAYIDDVMFYHAIAGGALLGNVITDHAGSDVADQMVNTVATVAEVNGVAIGGSGTDIAGDYGTLHINPDGSYEYHANAGVAAGHDDAFVYKLSSAADSDYATLNIHIGSGDTHLQASAESWTGSGNTNDFHLGTTGGDTLNGGNGDDVIFGNYGNDVIHGNAGNDYLHGGAGNDTLYGDAGNDILVGGQGSDILYGDGPGVSVHGADTFMWNAEDFTKNAVDTVKDFAPGEGDVLRFADVLLDHDGNSANGIQLDLVRMSGADSNNAQLTLHHGAETQTVVIENVFNSGMTSSQVDATLQAMEQHILNHKIITEHS
ncbi:MAG TPA: VWA domain-containing protein [Nitratidesulfovibrio sp.]|nr:VWA domain-containing protein [Nitratidesulfovibrio sp.]